MRPKLEAGQLWQVRGWGKVGTFLLLEKQRLGAEQDRWLTLLIDEGRSCFLWDDFAKDERYATRIM